MLTSDPALERDSGLSSHTILPAYSPQRLPAAPHNKALLRGLSGQKGPLERRLPSQGLSPLSPSSLPLALVSKGRKNSITEKIQGEQWSLEGILTRSERCQHLWEVDGRTAAALSPWPVTLKRLQCCFVVYERDLVPDSFQGQLNRAVVPAKRVCLAVASGQKRKQSLECRAFLPVARS